MIALQFRRQLPHSQHIAAAVAAKTQSTQRSTVQLRAIRSGLTRSLGDSYKYSKCLVQTLHHSVAQTVWVRNRLQQTGITQDGKWKIITLHTVKHNKV